MPAALPAGARRRYRLPASRHLVQRLRDREETDQHGHEPESVHQRRRSQGKAGRPGEHVEAHQEGDQADQRADDPLERIASDQIGDDGQPEHPEAEVLRWAERDRRPGQRSQRGHEQQGSENPAAHGGEEGDPERPAGLPRRVIAYPSKVVASAGELPERQSRWR